MPEPEIIESDRFGPARLVADAVLHEGNVLYPYRPSAVKNRMRWQFGVLGPPALATRPGHDRATCRTEVVFGGGAVAACVRFLRTVGSADEWLGTRLVEVEVDASTPRRSADGFDVALERWGPFVSVTVANTSPIAEAAHRDAALAHSLIAVHVILSGDGTFSSSVDPDPALRPLVSACTNEVLWPVLVGSSLVLACPIILYDNPEVAPESVGQWGDALEIEELLALRVLTLTDDERAEADGADPFAKKVMDQTDAIGDDLHGRLHGRITITPDALPPIGSTVRLHPRPGADAHDLFLDGRTATVVGHEADVDGGRHVRVLPDDDPGRDMHEWFGRSWFFRPEEVEAL